MLVASAAIAILPATATTRAVAFTTARRIAAIAIPGARKVMANGTARQTATAPKVILRVWVAVRVLAGKAALQDLAVKLNRVAKSAASATVAATTPRAATATARATLWDAATTAIAVNVGRAAPDMVGTAHPTATATKRHA